MKTKSLIIVLIFVSLLPWLWSAVNVINPGRFQLYFGTLMEGSQDNTLPFLSPLSTPPHFEKVLVCLKLDTQTGEVWRYIYEKYVDPNFYRETNGFVKIQQGEEEGDITIRGKKTADGIGGYDIYFDRGEYTEEYLKDLKSRKKVDPNISKTAPPAEILSTEELFGPNTNSSPPHQPPAN